MAAELQGYPNKWALLVGVNSYKYVSPLKFGKKFSRVHLLLMTPVRSASKWGEGDTGEQHPCPFPETMK